MSQVSAGVSDVIPVERQVAGRQKVSAGKTGEPLKSPLGKDAVVVALGNEGDSMDGVIW
jgi:hypothetical protein